MNFWKNVAAISQNFSPSFLGYIVHFFLLPTYFAGGTSFSGTIVPKYYSQRFIFRDFLEKTAVEVSSADIFLYNNSATAGRRGLAVFSMSIIDGQGHLLHSSSIGKYICETPLIKLLHISVLFFSSDDLDRSLNLEFLQTFVQVEKLSSDEEMEKEGIFLQFRLWEQGRIDMEDMVERFEAIVKHALWEVVTEYYLMPNDFMASTSSISNSSSSMVSTMQFQYLILGSTSSSFFRKIATSSKLI